MRSPNLSYLLILLVMLFTFTGCDVLLDIFEAGMWIGIILVVLVIALVVWLIRKFLG